ncbi:MAG: putative FAD-linked oxidoreductase [Dehalococcoidia bacterium]|nr:putative FAD-linked oxidoreductase [Dehalococcoidia bacterium]
MSVSGQIYASLASALGASKVFTEQSAVEEYSSDHLRPHRAPDQERVNASPLLVVRPTSTQDVITVVKVALEHETPIVPYGAGTGLMGGALATRGAITVDMKGMNRILGVSQEDMAAVVEGGVVLGDLNQELERHGLALGHDPWTLSVATVGGAISTNGLGYSGYRYGSMGDQALGLQVVLPNGELVETHGVPKASVGPYLKELFIGAEGTLGIITQATIRAFPRPEERKLLGFNFPSFEDGYRAILELFATGLRPSLLDFGEEYQPVPPQDGGREAPLEPYEVVLYLGFEGIKGEPELHAQRAAQACARWQGVEMKAEEVQSFWENRHWTGERRQGGSGTGGWSRPNGRQMDYVHVALPASKVLEYRKKAMAVLKQRGVYLRECGLWNQPELFSMVMVEPESGPGTLSPTVDEVIRLAHSMGGSMEYCHGVGVRLAHLMGEELGSGLEVLQEIKKALDPHNIMNPGKLGL